MRNKDLFGSRETDWYLTIEGKHHDPANPTRFRTW